MIFEFFILYIVLAELKYNYYIIKQLININSNLLVLTHFTSLLLYAITRNNFFKRTYKRTFTSYCTHICIVTLYYIESYTVVLWYPI